MISEFRANVSARNFHEIHRGAGTEAEKSLLPFTFLRNGTSIYTSRKEGTNWCSWAFFEEVGAAVYVCASHKTVLSTRHPAQPVSALILRPRDTSSVVTKLYDTGSNGVDSSS